MSISRKIALDRLNRWISELIGWRDEIDNPKALDRATGEEIEIYPGGPPEYASVGEMKGVDPEQLKGELSLIASEIDTLASLVQ